MRLLDITLMHFTSLFHLNSYPLITEINLTGMHDVQGIHRGKSLKNTTGTMFILISYASYEGDAYKPNFLNQKRREDEKGLDFGL